VKMLIENCAVLDPDAPWGYETGRYIAMEGHCIRAVTAERPRGDFEQVLSGRDRLVIPGLVNAHTHSSQNMLRATTECMPLEPWLIHLFSMSGEYSERDYYVNAAIGAIEMIRSGTTSVVDHLFMNPPFRMEAMDAVMNAYKDCGIRAAVAPLYGDAFYDFAYGRACGHALDAPFLIELERNRLPVQDVIGGLERIMRKWHGAENERLRVFAGPVGLQWCTEALLRESIDLARRHQTGVHMHLMETRLQCEAARHRFGCSGVPWMEERELLGPEVSLPHSVWVRTDKELEDIARTGALVVHNPASNLKLGSGLAPVRRMRERGIRVALGADGAASSDNQVMFECLRLAALIHNLADTDPRAWITSREAVRMATEGGAAAMGLPDRLGRIEAGCLADLVLLDLNASNMVPLNDAYKQLAFCESGSSVASVVVDGRLVYHEGKMQCVDADALLAEARQMIEGRPHQGEMPADARAAQKQVAAFQQAVACGA